MVVVHRALFFAPKENERLTWLSALTALDRSEVNITAGNTCPVYKLANSHLSASSEPS